MCRNVFLLCLRITVNKICGLRSTKEKEIHFIMTALIVIKVTKNIKKHNLNMLEKCMMKYDSK